MGCNEAKEQNYPLMLCFFIPGNEDQKNYCLSLKDNFKHEKPIRFEIKSMPSVPFAIKFKIKGKIHEIQNEFNNSEQAMNETLEKMYNLLEEAK